MSTRSPLLYGLCVGLMTLQPAAAAPSQPHSAPQTIPMEKSKTPRFSPSPVPTQPQLQPQSGGRPRLGVSGQIFLPPLPPLPALARETAAVLVLREMHEFGLSAGDIEAILPHLRRLREAELQVEREALQALREERRALLSARPGEPLPPSSGERLRKLRLEFVKLQESTWESLAREVGPEKSRVLGRWLRRGNATPAPQPSFPGQTPRERRPGVPGGAPGIPDAGGIPQEEPLSQALSLAEIIDLFEEKVAAGRRSR